MGAHPSSTPGPAGPTTGAPAPGSAPPWWRGRPALLVAALVLLALALRLPTAGEQSFWLDEVYTGRIVDGSLGHAWSTIQRTENTPPLFYLLDWGWSRLFGTGELALRSLSALAGALAVIPVVLLTRLVGGGTDDGPVGRAVAGEPAVVAARSDAGGLGRAAAGLAGALRRGAGPAATGPGAVRSAAAVPTAVALGAGLLLVVSPLEHWFSQEARSYALFVLLSGGAWTAMLAAAARPTRGRLWTWAALVVAATWTHYFGGLLLLVGWATIAAATHGRGRPLRPLAGPALVSLLLVAALAPIARNQQSTDMYQAISQVKGLGSRIVELPKQFAIGYSAPAELVLGIVLVAVLGVLVLAGAWPRAGRPTRGTVLLGTVAAVWVLPYAALAVGFDVVLTRNFVLLLPPLTVLAALGAWRLGRGAAVLLVGVGVVQLATIVLVAVTPVYQRDDWRGALRAAQDGRPVPQLLMIGRYQGPAATYYSPTLRKVPLDQPIAVRSIALLDRLEDGEALARIAAPQAPPGFVLREVDQRDQWRLFVWEAPRPTAVNPLGVQWLLPGGARAPLVRR